MKWYLLAVLSVVLYLIPTTCEGYLLCLRQVGQSGVISDSVNAYNSYYKCWNIEVPQGTYVRLEFKQLSLSNQFDCSVTYVKIIVTETKEVITYCPKDNGNWKIITALSDVNVTFSHSGNGYYTSSSFTLNYHIEDLICAQKNHFRCSSHSCIHQSKVCNGIKDCQNGNDEVGCEKGVLAVKGVNISRENTVKWLKNQRSVSVGWGKNTHRAITALYLSQKAGSRGQNVDEQLMVKQLELQASVALLRNSTDPVSVNELSMFINALTVTCHDPRKFYGYDLLQILSERASMSTITSPGVYLTLCVSNWTLSSSNIQSLLNLLSKPSEYPFHLDIKAMAVMALSCAKNKTQEFMNVANATDIYQAAVNKFSTVQLSDGSFGNVYTTALVSQALIASGEENDKRWNVTSAVQYLMNHLNSSSIDFLSAYLVLPVLSGSSLVDIRSVTCENTSRRQDDDKEISDLTNKLGGKMRIQYSLFIGDQKDIIHTIFLRVPDNSSAYDVMRVAKVADPKYKFLHRDVSGHMYVYEIAGITNDPEAGQFWLLYTGNNDMNTTVTHHTESPDKFILGDAEHLIMWYKTAQI